MTDRSVTHATFSLERVYAASMARVFAAWADPADHGTRLLLVEQGAFLDGREDPSWRERSTGGWLDALADELRRADERAPAEGSP